MSERLHFQYEGFANAGDRVMQMATTDKRTAERIRMAVADVLADARAEVSGSAKASMGSDPRQSFRAVRRSVYRKLFGGQVNILNKRRGQASPVPYSKARSLRPGQRGGNRIAPSDRTRRMDGYFGSDRGFILRFVSSGTDVRTTRFGNRGAIAARHWFVMAGERSMQRAAERLAQMVDEEIINAMK